MVRRRKVERVGETTQSENDFEYCLLCQGRTKLGDDKEEDEPFVLQQIDTQVTDLSNMTSYTNKGFLPNQLLMSDDHLPTEHCNYFDLEELRNIAPHLFGCKVEMGDGKLSRL